MRIILIAALFSLPLVAAATTQSLAASKYGPSATGGGSTGYNHSSAIDYKLKKHYHKKLHASAKPQASKASQ